MVVSAGLLVVVMVMMVAVVVVAMVMMVVVAATLLATFVVVMVMVTMVMVAMMVMTVMMMTVTAARLGITGHTAIFFMVMMMVVSYITLVDRRIVLARNTEYLAGCQVTGAIQPSVCRLNALDGRIVDCGKVFAVVTLLDNMLNLPMLALIASALRSARRLHSHRLNRRLVNWTVFCVCLGMVNTPSHRPGPDERSGTHSCLDYCCGVGNHNSDGLGNRHTLLANLGDGCCWSWLVAMTTLALCRLWLLVAVAAWTV